MNPVGMLIVAFVLALATEGCVEAVLGRPFNFIKRIQPYKADVLTYVGLVVGVLLSHYYQIDLIATTTVLAGSDFVIAASWVGFTLTGLIVGRGSNAVHDFIANVLSGTRKVVTAELITAPEAKS